MAYDWSLMPPDAKLKSIEFHEGYGFDLGGVRVTLSNYESSELIEACYHHSHKTRIPTTVEFDQNTSVRSVKALHRKHPNWDWDLGRIYEIGPIEFYDDEDNTINEWNPHNVGM